MRVAIFILVLSGLLFRGYSFAQFNPYKSYTGEDGLANSVVYRICKDKRGFIWLSTNYGLTRFDGHAFTNYYPENFRNNFILGICCDAQNRVWATGCSQDNRSLFYLEDGKVTEFVPRGNTLPMFITNLTPDANKRIWITCKDGKAGVLSDYETYTPFEIKSNEQKKVRIFKVLALKDSSVLFATNAGIYQLDKTQRVQLLSAKLPVDSFYSIAQDDSGKLYFGCAGKIFIYDAKRNYCAAIVTQNTGQIVNVIVNKPGNIWYSANLGYALITGNTERDCSKQTPLANVFINDMYADDDVIFLASGGKGLYVLNHTALTFYDERSGLKNPLVSCIRKNGNDIYAGSFGGVFKYSGDRFVAVKQIELPATERVNDILFAGGNMWVVTPFRCIRFSTTTSACSKYPHGGLCLCEDDNKNILIGSYIEVINLNAKTGERLTFPVKSPIENFRTYKILHSPISGYWYATAKGVFNFRNNTWKQYFEANSPLRSDAVDIEVDSLDNIWVATHSGLLKFDKEDKWELFDTRSGLSNAYCRHLYYNKGVLWIRTPRGLNSYNGGSFRSYSNGYGLPVEDVDVQLYDSAGNDLWITTSNGIYKWNQGRQEERGGLADVVVQPEDDNKKYFRQTDTLILPYRNNHVSFDFISPDYKMPENIIYEYRLDGANDTFHETKSRNLHFSSLNSGIYHFEIRARLKNNSIKSKYSNITIIVLKPVWQQWWFLVLAGGAVIFIIALVVRWRIQYIKRKEKQKAQRYSRLLQLKQEATNALISPHFIFNSLNSIQHFINKSDAVSANRFLSKFAGLIRATMENATNTNIRLHEEINILEKYLSLEAIRLPNLTYEINIAEDIDVDSMYIPSMLIQPYAENAIWHGITPKDGRGHVKIDITKGLPPYLVICIEDNGVGIDLEKKGKSRKSLGMEINKRRLRIIEQLTGHKVEFKIVPLYNDVDDLVGTRIKLKIPFEIKSRAVADKQPL